MNKGTTCFKHAPIRKNWQVFLSLVGSAWFSADIAPHVTTLVFKLKAECQRWDGFQSPQVCEKYLHTEFLFSFFTLAEGCFPAKPQEKC